MSRLALSTVFLSTAVTVAVYMGMHYFVLPHLPIHAVVVPPLGGLSPEQAHGMLEPSGLLLVLDGEMAEERITPGTLTAQHPLAGSRLRRGDSVHASVARAIDVVHIPRIAGMTAEAAKETLEQAKVHVGKVTEAPSDTMARGLVVSSLPAGGSESRPGATIDLVVSAGIATQPVPTLLGKRLSTAKQLLEKAGFVVGRTRYGSNDDYDAGVVISQEPVAGSQANLGLKVDLVVND